MKYTDYKKMLRVISLLFLYCTVIPVSAGYGGDHPDSKASSLTVEEYRIIPVPGNIGSGSMDIIKYYFKTKNEEDHLRFKAAQQKRAKWRKKPIKDRQATCYRQTDSTAGINDGLATFNYKLIKKKQSSGYDHFYELCKGDDVLISFDGIDRFGVNKQETGFFLTAYNHIEDSGITRYLVHNGKIQKWDNTYISFPPPIFIKDSLLSIIWGEPGHYMLQKNATPIYNFSVQDLNACCSIEAFFSMGDNWVIEYDETVVVNGINIGDQKNYSNVFNYRAFKEKPFFFFKQDGKTQLSYDNKILPNSYESVLHYMCCEYSGMNPGKNDHMIWFYALNNGYLYYVEAGIYD